MCNASTEWCHQKSFHTIKGNVTKRQCKKRAIVTITMLVSSFEAVSTARISQRTQLDCRHRHRHCHSFQKLAPSYSSILTTSSQSCVTWRTLDASWWLHWGWRAPRRWCRRSSRRPSADSRSATFAPGPASHISLQHKCQLNAQDWKKIGCF